MSEENSLVGRFTFAMVLAVNFLLGAMFLLLSGPLILLLSWGERYENLAAIYSSGYPKVVTLLVSVNAQALSVSALFIASFVLGHLGSVVDRLLAFLVGAAGNRLRGARFADDRHRRHYFTSREMAGDDYPGFLSWLLSSRSYHAHWEWELHLHYLRWGTFTQVFLYFGFLLWLLDWKMSWGWLVAAGIVCSMMLVAALEGSAVMHQVHNYYLDLKARADGKA